MLTKDACYNLAGGSLMSPLRIDGRNLDIVGRFIYSYISQWCEGSFFDIMMVTSWMCLACATNVLPPFINIICFSFVKQMYLDKF
jgi:hypothetical protein